MRGPSESGASLSRNGNGYIYKSENDDTEIYDSTGRLLSITQRNGVTEQLTYSNGQLSNVQDSFDRALNFDYDAQGRLANITTPGGSAIGFDYHAAGPLRQITHEDGTSKRYEYQDTNLTSLYDENGALYATWNFENGRATSNTLAGGVGAFTVNYGNGSTTVTSPLGLTTTYSFLKRADWGKTRVLSSSQSCAGTCGTAASNTYNAQGNVISRTDFNGHVTRYGYDLSRNLETSRTEAFGTPQARTITTQWHGSFRLPIQRDEPGRRTVYTYDSNGNRLSSAVTDTATGDTRTTTATYNGLGQVTSVDGPRSDVSDLTQYQYDAQGNLSVITNALNQVTQITSHDAHGNPLRLLDANNVETLLTYDLRQRLKTRSVAGATTRYDYDPAGQLTQVTLPDLSSLAYSYDPAHRLTAIQDNLGNRIAYTLDAIGNRTQTEVLDPQGALKRTQSQVFDALSRLKEIRGANGQVTQYDYDPNGNLTAQTQAGQFSSLNQYDALNRLSQVSDPNTGTTGYQYDALDRLSAVTDPKNLVTQYSTNAFGDLTRQVSPDTGLTTYTYDASGNRKTQTDARGVSVSYSYDALNRLISETYADSSLNKTYSYDSGPNGLGRLSAIAIPGKSQSWSYVYDARGNLIRESSTLSGQTQNTDYQYDAADRITSITYPTGRIVNTPRDAVGRIAGVSMTQGTATTPLAQNLQYLPFGPATNWTLGNGIAVSHSYDQDYRITIHSDAGILNRTLSYNSRDLITGISDSLTPSRSQSLGYDAVQRLTQAQGSYGTRAYTYNDSGDRTSESRNGTQNLYSYPANSHRLSSAGATGLSYDAAGNTTTRGALTLNYNAGNRLSGTGAGQSALLYTPSGQRQAQTHQGKTSRYAYDSQGHLIVESSGNGSVTDSEYVWLDDLPLAMVARRKPLQYNPALNATLNPILGPGSALGNALAANQPNNTVSPAPELFYFHSDHLNTPQKLTDTSKAVVWDAQYEPFGQVTLTTELVINPLRMPGQYFDAETGLHQNWFREYDPTTDRYTQFDPIGLRGGINGYIYANANPLSFIDPMGLDPWSSAMTMNPQRATADAAVNSPEGRAAQAQATMDAMKDSAKKGSCFAQCMAKKQVGEYAAQKAADKVGDKVIENIPLRWGWPAALTWGTLVKKAGPYATAAFAINDAAECAKECKECPE